MQIDRAPPFGARVSDRLSTETIIWLTTVGKDGTLTPNRRGSVLNTSLVTLHWSNIDVFATADD